MRNYLWHSSLGGVDTQVGFHAQMMKLLDCSSWDSLLERPPVKICGDQSCPKGQHVCHLLSRLLHCSRPGPPTGSCPLTADDSDVTAGLLVRSVQSKPSTPLWTLSLGCCFTSSPIYHLGSQIKSLGGDEPGLLEDLLIPHDPLITCWTWRYWNTIQIALNSSLFSIQVTGPMYASS